MNKFEETCQDNSRLLAVTFSGPFGVDVESSFDINKRPTREELGAIDFAFFDSIDCLFYYLDGH